MATRHLSLRIKSDTFDRLDHESRRTGQSRSELAKTLIEEGLRMQTHPGIVFRSGPAGRRPGLAGGPDVWEVMRVCLGIRSRGEQAIQQTAELSGLTPEQVRVALRYYADYPHEIDDWIRQLDEEAEEAEARWLREQNLLRS